VAGGKKRLSRKELVQQDQITSGLEDAVEWIMDHPRPFLWGIGAVIVVVVLATGWTLYARNRSESAQVALGNLIRVYRDMNSYDSDVARLQATLNAAREVEGAYGGLQAARIASYYEALAHEGLGEDEEAAEILEALANSTDPTIRPLAAFALGQNLRRQGNVDRAIEICRDLLDSGEYSAPVLLFELGGLSEEAGRLEEAENYYESIRSEYAGSVLEPEAEQALKRLRTTGSGRA
jgi:tetratricopeptide (TPR) repeat protein